MTVNEMFKFLIENEIASQDFINGAVCIGGRNRKTVETILSYCEGWEDFVECLDEEEE